MKQTIQATGAVNPAYMLLHTAVEQTLEQLEISQPVSDEAIHDARKALKKARAALRLLQDGMKETTFRIANSKMRDAGRLLSPLRDAKSLIDAFDSLHDRYSDKLQEVEFAPLRKILRANLTAARRHLHLHRPGTSTDLRNAIRLLKDCLALAKQESFRSIDSAVISPGLQRIYRKGRKAQAEAGKYQTTEALHEWRKQVKYLLNAADGLQTSGHASTEKILKWTDRMADCLGDDHELAMLAQEIARGTYARIDADVIKTLQTLIDCRQATLQKRAFKLGKKVYDERPKQFVKRMLEHAPLSTATSSTGSMR